MKLIWHIIRKDIVRDRWAIVLWAGLFLAQTGLGLGLLRYDAIDKELIVQWQLGVAGLIFLQMVMGYILVARLVQADALIGSELFWVTRPISRGRLLAAKALGALLVFGLLPVLLLLPWWLYNGFSARDIFWVAVETFGWQLLMIAPAFLVASLTDDLGRLLLWTLLLVIGGLTWLILLQSLNVPVVVLADGNHGVGLILTRIWLLCLLGVAVSAVLAAVHYLSRNFRQSVILVFFGLGFIVLAGLLWTRDWSKFLADITRPTPLAPAGLVEGMTIQPGYAWQAGPLPQNRNREKESTIRVLLDVQGLPDDTGVIADNVTQTWRWSGSPVFKHANEFGQGRFPSEVVLRRTYSLPVPEADPETTHWWQAQREREQAERMARGLPPPTRFFSPPELQKNKAAFSIYAVLSDAVIAKMRQTPPAYTVHLQGMISRPVIVAEFPPVLSAWAAGDSQTFHLSRIRSNRVDLKKLGSYEGIGSTMVQTAPTIRASGLWLIGEIRPRGSWFFRRQMMSVNRTTGDIRALNEATVGELRIGGVAMIWRDLWLEPPTVIRDGKYAVKDSQWMKHTSLVMLGEKELARFTREIQVDRLEIKEPVAANNP